MLYTTALQPAVGAWAASTLPQSTGVSKVIKRSTGGKNYSLDKNQQTGKATYKKASGANQKVISELESPILDGRRVESGAKVDDVKPVWGKDSKGRPVIEKEFPQVAKEHGFPDIIDNYPTSANEYPLIGGDGIDRKFFQLEGSNNAKNGVFEWIVEPNGDISHRRFIDGGVLTGKPNQIPKK